MTQKPNYAAGDILELKIEKIVPRGLGLAFVEGLTVFVPLSVAGDIVRAEIKHIKKRIAFASIVDIIEQSGNRIVPPCPHFGVCGGCDFQQMNYETQLRAKLDIIRDCLKRIGKIEFEDLGIIPSPNEFGYRSRARWHADREQQKIGYYARDSHDTVDVDVCPILSPELEAVLRSLRQNIDWPQMWADTAEIEAAAGDRGAVSLYSSDMAEPTAEITCSHAGIEYAFSARSFFQGNQSLIGDLVRLAIGDASGETALDLYCGIGLFALAMAKQFTNVIGVEENGEAVRFAKQNKARAAAANVEFKRMRVGDFLKGHELSKTDLVLIDPPRAGAEDHVVELIAKMAPRAISYVSCEPSILARDLRILLDRGYRIDTMTAIDLFPQTHHVETIVRLSR
ncbi:MAG: class I SAM-dependent RNA methyltransferase [Pyrinomonadaceae bacterium]|nr:class I SAM-dependent RNA methyltransferase [Pyrinomonadaceae bacterium]